MGFVEGRKSPKRAGKGVLGRARIWAVGSQYSQEAWGVRRKSRGQQGPQYGPHGGRKIPKTSWVWMHPHGCDVTQEFSRTGDLLVHWVQMRGSYRLGSGRSASIRISLTEAVGRTRLFDSGPSH
ncbi:hypothetical protein DFH09DRAFT_1075868 [Mycena vulgaris]|nr:hypothetical protein DFH09DRAFT_1075868 [Mycena vulgaris]